MVEFFSHTQEMQISPQTIKVFNMATKQPLTQTQSLIWNVCWNRPKYAYLTGENGFFPFLLETIMNNTPLSKLFQILTR